VVFDCVGSAQSVNESLKWTRARGQVVMIGTASGGSVDLTPIWFRELRVLGAYGRQIEDFRGRKIGTYQLVHELMTAGKLPVEFMLTHKFRIDQHKQAIGTAIDKSRHQAIKVAFDFR
jgi:L-iditol 2-dehydrogenase